MPSDAAVLQFAETKQDKPKRGRFQPGQSGNPAGRKRGVKDKRAIFREALADHADGLIQAVIEQALAGDVQAQKLCLDRLIPALRPESAPMSLTMPKGGVTSTQDLLAAHAGIIKAMAGGKVSPDDAKAMSALLEGQRKMIELTDIVERLECLEAQR